MIRTFVMIGAGNLATSLGPALKNAGLQCLQVYNRSEDSGKILASKLNAGYTGTLSGISHQADLYVICVADKAVAGIASSIHAGEKIVVHTSGSLDMDVIRETSSNTGVLYPLQTFTKLNPEHFQDIPICIEAVNENTGDEILLLANLLSNNVVLMNSSKRLMLHLAATFACNFTNYFYVIASEILRNDDLSMDLLMPLIMKTAGNASAEDIFSLQTGPAVREDLDVMKRHLDLLQAYPGYAGIYSLISKKIINHKHKNDKL